MSRLGAAQGERQNPLSDHRQPPPLVVRRALPIIAQRHDQSLLLFLRPVRLSFDPEAPADRPMHLYIFPLQEERRGLLKDDQAFGPAPMPGSKKHGQGDQCGAYSAMRQHLDNSMIRNVQIVSQAMHPDQSSKDICNHFVQIAVKGSFSCNSDNWAILASKCLY